MATYVYRNNQQMGPYDAVDVRLQLADGQLSYDDLGWSEGAANWVPLRVLFQPAGLPPPPARATYAPVAPSANSLVCHVCQRGELVRKKKYRMSAPVVAIGYIFLIPSILGVLAGCMLLFLSFGASDSGGSVFLVGGFAVTIIVSAFVGGLLGWLLVMKKRVLACENCGAVVAAS